MVCHFKERKSQLLQREVSKSENIGKNLQTRIFNPQDKEFKTLKNHMKQHLQA